MVGVKESIESLKEKLPEPLSTLELTMNIMISLAIGGLTIFLFVYYFFLRNVKPIQVIKNIGKTISGPPKPRFRKRDKVMFYGRKMLRRVKSFARNVSTSGSKRSKRGKKIMFSSLAKKILVKFKKDSAPQLIAREPHPSLLEVDWRESLTENEYRLPMEVMYMLRSVRVLGHFEKPLFLELCRFMESRFVPAGTYLFKVGDMDDSIYVVQSGVISVFVADQDGKEHCVKEVGKGESIHSLLSVLDVLTGHTSTYKTVSAIACVDCTILRLPAKAFQIVLDRFPESLVRVVQIIMVRLQRVTFMALHNYLGLSYELVNAHNQSDRTFSVHSITMSPKGSPMRLVSTTTTAQAFPNPEVDRDKAGQAGLEDDTPSSLVLPVPVVITTNASDPLIECSGSESSLGTKDWQDMKKKLGPSRRGSEPIKVRGSSSSESVEPSDFQAACTRARVGLPLDEDPIVSGSPPIRSHLEELGPHGLGSTPVRKPRKTLATEPTSGLLGTSQEDVHGKKPYLDDDDLFQIAIQDIVKLFGLEDEGLLLGKCFLRHIKSGTTLLKQGDPDASLYFVVTGQLQVQQQVVGGNEVSQRILFTVHPGELVDPLAVLTGEPAFFTIRSRSDARVVVISKSDFYGIMKEQPKIVLNVGHSVVKRMSTFVRQIDFALDWMLIEAGRALFRQGEKSDSIYIILNGRLRSVVETANGKKELVGEYGRGELVGLVEVLTQTERATTVMAVRDTELAQIPEELLNLIKRRYPQIVTRLIHLLSNRILGSLQQRPNIASALSEHPNQEPRPSVANLATIAVVPISDDVPLSSFTLELQLALNGIGPTLRLASDIIKTRIGPAAMDAVNEYRLSTWLGQQEDIHRMVLYQCDYRMSPWTKRCITQADCILVVGLADNEPSVGPVEKQMENLAVRAQKELILLHKEESGTPRRTVEWLNLRDWCSSHHHIRCPKRVFSRKKYDKLAEAYRKAFESNPDRMSDFARLARILTGTAIGLVLGGGGARGLSHVGIIRAMREYGIPIDYIGGTSMGSLIGGLWAEDLNMTRFTQRAREWCKDMNCLWKKLIDLTYPTTAMFSGHAFNKCIENAFKDKQIEDLWIPYFAVTTDITASKMRVHTHGSLWRYVRASMSLSGYLPPLCDPVDGNLLLDGGYVNNLPADVMKSMGAQTVFAVDVGSIDDAQLTNYGDTLSGWWLMWKKWAPWAKPVRVPNMAEVQSRLAYVSCVRQLEQVKSSEYCEYIRPPIDKYGTLQFGAFEEINEVGYNHGKVLFQIWERKGLVNDLFKENSSDRIKPQIHKTVVPAEANFIDLAGLISRIDSTEEKKTSFFIGGSDDEYDDYEDDDDDEDDEDEDDDDEEHYSVTSEPIVSLVEAGIKKRPRAGSEGATPGSTPTDDDLEELDESPEESDMTHDMPPGSPPRVSTASSSIRAVSFNLKDKIA